MLPPTLSSKHAWEKARTHRTLPGCFQWKSDQPANKARANYEALMAEAKHALEYLRTKIGDPLYVFSTEKGYLMLSDFGRARYGIRTVNVTISATNACFGGQ